MINILRFENIFLASIVIRLMRLWLIPNILNIMLFGLTILMTRFHSMYEFIEEKSCHTLQIMDISFEIENKKQTWNCYFEVNGCREN